MSAIQGSFAKQVEQGQCIVNLEAMVQQLLQKMKADGITTGVPTVAPSVEPTAQTIVPLVVVPRAYSEHVVVHQTVTVPLPTTTPTPRVPLTETVVAEKVTAPTVADKKKDAPQSGKPKAKSAKALSTAKSKSTEQSKPKQKKTKQKAKVSSPKRLYSFSASFRRFREKQLWLGVDPYADKTQSLYQLWEDMTRPPELIQ